MSLGVYVSVNGCLFKCVSPVTDRTSVQGVLCLWERLQLPHNPDKDKRKKTDGMERCIKYILHCVGEFIYSLKLGGQVWFILSPLCNFAIYWMYLLNVAFGLSNKGNSVCKKA